MVPVSPDHRFDVAAGEILPSSITDVLPPWHLLEDQEPQLVAAVQEVSGLRIVGGTDDVALELVFQDPSVAPLRPGRHRSPHVWVGLVSVQAAQLEMSPVEVEAAWREPCLPKADPSGVLVNARVALVEPYEHLVEPGVI